MLHKLCSLLASRDRMHEFRMHDALALGIRCRNTRWLVAILALWSSASLMGSELFAQSLLSAQPPLEAPLPLTMPPNQPQRSPAPLEEVPPGPTPTATPAPLPPEASPAPTRGMDRETILPFEPLLPRDLLTPEPLAPQQRADASGVDPAAPAVEPRLTLTIQNRTDQPQVYALRSTVGRVWGKTRTIAPHTSHRFVAPTDPKHPLAALANYGAPGHVQIRYDDPAGQIFFRLTTGKTYSFLPGRDIVELVETFPSSPAPPLRLNTAERLAQLRANHCFRPASAGATDSGNAQPDATEPKATEPGAETPAAEAIAVPPIPTPGE